MLATGAAILLSMAAISADSIDNSRKAFSNCLRNLHNTSVTEKDSLSSFREKVKTACEAERSAYNAAVVRSERGFGSSAKEAEAYAAEEVAMIVEVIISAFGDNAAQGITLVPEA
jgi:hypothetical protein